MIFCHRFEAGNIKRSRQFYKRRIRSATKARQVTIAGIKQNNSTRAQIGVELGISPGTWRRLSLGNGPIQQRKKGQLIFFKVKAKGGGWLNRGAGAQHTREPFEALSRDLINPFVAGYNIPQGNLLSENDHIFICHFCVCLRQSRHTCTCKYHRQYGPHPTADPQAGDDIDNHQTGGKG